MPTGKAETMGCGAILIHHSSIQMEAVAKYGDVFNNRWEQHFCYVTRDKEANAKPAVISLYLCPKESK
jgi:hypothetical protein